MSSGRFTRLRYIIFAVLIALYIVHFPFVKIGGHPAVFMDIVNRRFYLFGGVFNAQDFWLMFFLLSGVGLTLRHRNRDQGASLVRVRVPTDGLPRGRVSSHRAAGSRARARNASTEERRGAPDVRQAVWRKTLKHLIYIALALVPVARLHQLLRLAPIPRGHGPARAPRSIRRPSPGSS